MTSGHDMMCRVLAVNTASTERTGQTRLAHVEDGGRRAGCCLPRAARAREVLQETELLGGMPGEVRQMPREIHRMLARSAADLQHLRPVGETDAQHRENRLLVSLASFGERQHAQNPGGKILIQFHRRTNRKTGTAHSLGRDCSNRCGPSISSICARGRDWSNKCVAARGTIRSRVAVRTRIGTSIAAKRAVSSTARISPDAPANDRRRDGADGAVLARRRAPRIARSPHERCAQPARQRLDRQAHGQRPHAAEPGKGILGERAAQDHAGEAARRIGADADRERARERFAQEH